MTVISFPSPGRLSFFSSHKGEERGRDEGVVVRSLSFMRPPEK